MSANDIHGIEHGWTVKSHDGQTLGTVEETTEAYILVKDGLINSTKHYVRSVHLAHVRPDEKEIGLDLAKDEFASQDWSDPNVEPPRWDVPIHAEAEDDEPDPARQAAIRDPERPATV